jgi:hypothetical protein
MRQVEREEEATAAADPEGLQLHLCIINLVIGTLYCSKVRWVLLWPSVTTFDMRSEILFVAPLPLVVAYNLLFRVHLCIISLVIGTLYCSKVRWVLV